MSEFLPARRRWLMWSAGALALPGCASTERAEPYGNSEWLQSGANRIANLALRDNLQSIRRVQLSLYRRNPREWRKWSSSADDAIQRTWDFVMQAPPAAAATPAATTSLPANAEPPLGPAALRGATGIEAIRLAFETAPRAFEGDRVAALTIGWATMLKAANGGTWAQTMLDGVNAENSYRAARNMEISLWLLHARTGPDGQPLLLATEISERGRNLLVDRELSKVTGRLDLMAAQADEKYRRAALDFSQNWLLGSLGPLLSLVQR